MARPKPSSGLLPNPFVDSLRFWQRSTCHSPKAPVGVLHHSSLVVRVSIESLKILIAALSSSVAY
jgi:hypothetical protein